MAEPYASRNEAILQAMIDGTDYTDMPHSRIEYLLIQLKEAIEAGGGGGGGTTNYNGLTNKPKINGVELRGDKSSEELNILGDKALTTEQMNALLALID